MTLAQTHLLAGDFVEGPEGLIHEEQRRAGSAPRAAIEAGKIADLVVLSGDIMTGPEDRIPDTKVLATLVGGRVAHDVGLFDGSR